MNTNLNTIEWVGGGTKGFIRIIDQTLLPAKLEYIDCHKIEEVWEAIKTLKIRGAPAIGIMGAMGVVLGMQGYKDQFAEEVKKLSAFLKTSRPTAINLFWALERMERCAEAHPTLPRLLDEAQSILEEDRNACQEIGLVGANFVEDGMGILTHCNAGGLATSGYGTALAVIYKAVEQGKKVKVFVDETRPLLQGSRLTAWELQRKGIDTTLICDNMAGKVMAEGKVQMVVVGADRIAANGDTANKIGTYGVAILAKYHKIPFYVAAPSNTFDLATKNGSKIPIETRDGKEITRFGLFRASAPTSVKTYNPAFDITPARLISRIMTEKGCVSPVNKDMIAEIVGE